MNQRNSRTSPTRSGAALIHRGPQAFSAPHVAQANYPAPMHHAPNAALLIDFDNVTMGIRTDLGKELRSLLGSDIIKGKVAVQRAYADWRRYPQYIVPLAESSIDMIMAPAYGSSKKNATDIRLAVDAMELVFTRPEIGTYILLSGDSDFASLVTKLKEYGKYVIGVGIKESSSDLLVMNCDEYYSYNALAGLVNARDEEPTKKWDPWELVTEAVNRMKRNSDVMRSDRLKQVMQEIDSTFDEKDLGMSKFSRFVQDAVNRGLISATKLDNGQLEIGLPAAVPASAAPVREATVSAEATTPAADEQDRARNGRPRRGRRGRGGRDREDRPRAAAGEGAATPPTAAAQPKAPTIQSDGEAIGLSGERLTRDEAFDLLRRITADLPPGDSVLRAGAVRAKARTLLGRDSESLSDRNFPRILKDAHDNDVIDLRRRGDDFEVARVAVPPAVDKVADVPAGTAASASTPPVARGIATRGVAGQRGRGRPGSLPPELLSIGVVKPAASVAAPAVVSQASPEAAASTTPPETKPAKGGRKPAAKKTAGRSGPVKTPPSKAKVKAAAPVPAAAAQPPAPPKKEGAKKPRARKAAHKEVA